MEEKQIAIQVLSIGLSSALIFLFLVTTIIWVQPIMDLVVVVVSLLVLRVGFQEKHGSSETDKKSVSL